MFRINLSWLSQSMLSHSTPETGSLKTCENKTMTKPTVTQNLMRMLDLSPVEAAPASFGSDEVSTA